MIELAEATEPHSRLLRCSLCVEESRAYWAHVDPADPRTSAQRAFTESWFGAKSEAWTTELPIRQSWANALIEISKTGTAISYPPTDRVIEARELVGGGVQKIYLGQGNAKDVMCQVDADLAKLQ